MANDIDQLLAELRLIRGIIAAQFFYTLDQADLEQKAKIKIMSKTELTPKEIGDLLGISANSVSVTQSKLRKEGSLPALKVAQKVAADA